MEDIEESSYKKPKWFVPILIKGMPTDSWSQSPQPQIISISEYPLSTGYLLRTIPQSASSPPPPAAHLLLPPPPPAAPPLPPAARLNILHPAPLYSLSVDRENWDSVVIKTALTAQFVIRASLFEFAWLGVVVNVLITRLLLQRLYRPAWVLP